MNVSRGGFEVYIICIMGNIYNTYKELLRLHKCVEKTLNRLADSIRGCGGVREHTHISD